MGPARLGIGYGRAVPAGILALCSCAALACSSADGSSAGPRVRDSAGVRIVENPASAIERSAFVIADSAAVVIGERAGDPNHELSSIADATRLPDGRIVIALGGRDQQLRYYDSTGAFLHATGRAGGGPGEFTSIRALVPLDGGELLVADVNGRLSRFDRAGAFRSSTEYRAMAGGTTYIGRLADGAVAGSRRKSAVIGERFDVEHWFLRYTPDAGVPDTIAGPLMSERIIIDGVITSPVFSVEPVAVASGDALHAAGGPVHEIRTWGADRVLRRIARVAVPERAVTSGDLTRDRENRLSRARPERRAELARTLERMPALDFFPAFSAMLVDAAGRVWVRRFATQADTTTQWLVFDGDGALLGSVVTAQGLTVLEIGQDYMLARRQGADDVPVVVMHRFRPA